MNRKELEVAFLCLLAIVFIIFCFDRIPPLFIDRTSDSLMEDYAVQNQSMTLRGPCDLQIKSVRISVDGGKTWVDVAEDSYAMHMFREWERQGIITRPDQEL